MAKCRSYKPLEVAIEHSNTTFLNVHILVSIHPCSTILAWLTIMCIFIVSYHHTHTHTHTTKPHLHHCTCYYWNMALCHHSIPSPPFTWRVSAPWHELKTLPSSAQVPERSTYTWIILMMYSLYLWFNSLCVLKSSSILNSYRGKDNHHWS